MTAATVNLRADSMRKMETDIHVISEDELDSITGADGVSIVMTDTAGRQGFRITSTGDIHVQPVDKSEKVS